MAKAFILVFAALFATSFGDDEIKDPECMLEGNVGTCCLKIAPKIYDKRICLKGTLDLEHSKGEIDLYLGGRHVQNAALATGPQCKQLLPPFSLESCIDVYHLVIDSSKLLVEACATVSVKKMIQFNFACVKFVNGTFTHHSDIKPSEYGLINVANQDGQVKWTIKTPKTPGFWKKAWRNVKSLVTGKEHQPGKQMSKFIENED